jgi:isoleucyl-tRNA synthetase
LLGAEAEQYRQDERHLDVWFDSGTTHWHVKRGSHASDRQRRTRPTCTSKAPTSIAAGSSPRCSPAAPSTAVRRTRQLLTHGFVVDGKGHKMSKSKGNVIAPQQVNDKMGADILRLWTASTDYSGELAISDEILKRVVEGYRRIRNTLRFLLANVSDFDAKADMLPVAAMAGNRPLRAGPDPRTSGQLPRRLRPLRIPPRRPGVADLLLRRSRRLLSRHPEGPPVHDGA